MPPTPDAPAPSSSASNLVVVAAVVGMLAAGALLSPSGTGDGTTLSLLGIRLPTVCMFLLTTGLPCPGCGLTRSIVLLMHGRLGASMAMHPFGVAVVGLALLQLPPRAVRGAGAVSAWTFRYDRLWLGAMAATAVLALVWWSIHIGVPSWLGL